MQNKFLWNPSCRSNYAWSKEPVLLLQVDKSKNFKALNLLSVCPIELKTWSILPRHLGDFYLLLKKTQLKGHCMQKVFLDKHFLSIFPSEFLRTVIIAWDLPMMVFFFFFFFLFVCFFAAFTESPPLSLRARISMFKNCWRVIFTNP